MRTLIWLFLREGLLFLRKCLVYLFLCGMVILFACLLLGGMGLLTEFALEVQRPTFTECISKGLLVWAFGVGFAGVVLLWRERECLWKW